MFGRMLLAATGLLWLSALITLVGAKSVQGGRLLVVTDANTVLEQYSLFWDSLRDRGYSLAFRGPQDSTPLGDYDNLSFDHLVLFAPTSKHFSAELSPQSLYGYVQQGRNLLVILSPELSEFWRDFAREFDLDFDDRGHQLIDHFSHDRELDDGSHTTLVIPLSTAPVPFVSPSTRSGPPLLYRGTAHDVGRIPLLTNVLHARPSSYSYDAAAGDAPSEDAYLAGSAAGLVSSMQAKNNARVTFAGSLDLFTDVFASASVASADGTKYSQSGNVAFIKDLTQWTFHESGLLKVEATGHSRASDGESLGLYRVNDDLAYDIDIATLEEGSWTPYNADDLQLEFTMLDPHLRLPLSSTPNSKISASATTRFSARFRTPDRHGVFTLKVDYRRAGWTFIDEKAVVSITPPRHDEYDRFIVGALPYYGGAFSVSLATIAFVVLWALQ